MISFITAEETLSMRSELLLDGKIAPDDCRFDEDALEGAFHLGYKVDDRIVCICSFAPKELDPFGADGFQLRGMATDPAYRNKGIGNLVVNFGVLYLRGRNARYIWCNARREAYTFYAGLGFETISAEFEIEGVGPHKKMYLKIS